MQEFSITTHLTTKDYTKIMFTGLYKRPVYILATVLGLYLFTTAFLDIFGIIEWYSETPIYETALGLFLIASPTIIAVAAIQQFKSNPNFKDSITYTFGEDLVCCKAATFKTEFLWSNILKQKEMGNYLVLYQTKKTGIFIDKTQLTSEQIAFIKSKITQKQ